MVIRMAMVSGVGEARHSTSSHRRLASRPAPGEGEGLLPTTHYLLQVYLEALGEGEGGGVTHAIVVEVQHTQRAVDRQGLVVMVVVVVSKK